MNSGGAGRDFVPLEFHGVIMAPTLALVTGRWDIVYFRSLAVPVPLAVYVTCVCTCAYDCAFNCVCNCACIFACVLCSVAVPVTGSHPGETFGRIHYRQFLPSSDH